MLTLFRLSLIVGSLTFLPTSIAQAKTTVVHNRYEMDIAIIHNNGGPGGDVISVANDIVLDGPLTPITWPITIHGNGHTVAVAEPGVTEGGIANPTPSPYRVFTIRMTHDGLTTLKNIHLIGGKPIDGSGGGVVYKQGQGTLLLDRVIMERGYVEAMPDWGSNQSGGGLLNMGLAYVRNSVFQANWAGFGGGFENRGTMYLDGSSVVGNRSTRSEGGGAGGENGDYGLLFVNNTNFANNTAMEGGAGLNNAGNGKSYVVNSTFAGNVGNIQNLANPFGGGAANTGTTTSGGTLKIASSLFAYNYLRVGNRYVLNDASSPIQGSGAPRNKTQISASILSARTALAAGSTNNLLYPARADGLGNTLLNNGSMVPVLNATGNPVIAGKNVMRPGLVSPYGGIQRLTQIQCGGYATRTQGSVPTRWAPGSSIMSWYNRFAAKPAWVEMGAGQARGAKVVSYDQAGVRRFPGLAPLSPVGAADGDRCGPNLRLYDRKPEYSIRQGTKRIVLRVYSKVQGAYTLTVTLAGKRVALQTGQMKKGDNSIQVNTSRWKGGNYQIRVSVRAVNITSRSGAARAPAPSILNVGVQVQGKPIFTG